MHRELFQTFFIFLFAVKRCKVELTSGQIVVDSSFGTIVGSKLSSNGSIYVAFRGIPYAKPPIGEYRFQKSEMHAKLEGQFDGTKESVACIRPEPHLHGTSQGVEDCLVLNIYMRELYTSKLQTPKKVLVYIHGGRFSIGASREFIPATMVLTHDVIVVTFNYRLGVLGFLSTDDEASPGNFGLWDQVLALRWVKENIPSFGGDADDITVTGVSAGAVSIQLISISPYGIGLFSKAVPGGGGASMVSNQSMHPLKDALEAAVYFKCWTGSPEARISLENSRKVIECLKKLPESEFGKYETFSMDRSRFYPTVDGVLIPDNPKRLLKDVNYLDSVNFFDRSYLVYLNNNEKAVISGFIAGVKYMVYSNSAIHNDHKQKTFAKLITSGMNSLMLSALDVNNREDVFDKICDWYEMRASFEDSVANIMTDAGIIVPTFDFLLATSLRRSTRTWFLLFDHYPTIMKNADHRGMIHGLDVLFLMDFDLEYMGKLMWQPLAGHLQGDDLRVKGDFISMIVGFAKNGNPNHSLLHTVPSGVPQWEPVHQSYLSFGPRPRVRNEYKPEVFELWTELVQTWLAEENRQTHDEL